MKNTMCMVVAFLTTLFLLGNTQSYDDKNHYDVHPQPYDNAYEKPVDVVGPGIAGFAGIGKIGGIGSVLAAKKGLLVAPLVLGAKAAVFSVPMATGALLGAPIGAVSGAVIGAKVGAVKGAALAKAAVVGKLALAKAAVVGKVALAKKAAVAAKGVATAIVMKPIALAVGATAAAVTAKKALVSKGMGIINTKVHEVHTGVINAGAQLKSTASSLANSVNLLQTLLPLLLTSQNKPTETYTYKKPSTLEATYTLDTPVTGYQYGKANLVSARRKRQASAPASAQRVNQLLTLVNQQRQGPCVQRVICELMVDHNKYGQEGVRFGFSLLQYSFLDHPGIEPYKAAAALGVKHKDARVCVTQKCQLQSIQVIRLGLALLGV